MVLISMGFWVKFFKESLKNLQNLRHRAILQAISALKLLQWFLIQWKIEKCWMETNALFFRCVYNLAQTDVTCLAPKSCLVYHYPSNTYRDSMYPLVQDTFGPCFGVGTKIRPTDSGSNKTIGVHSAHCKDGGARCWIYTVFNFMNPMQNCVLFLTKKSFSILFVFVRQTSTQFPGQQEECQHPQVA